MAFSVEYIYQITDRFSANLRKFSSLTDKVESRIASARSKMQQFQRTLGSVGAKMRNFGAGMAAGITLPLFAFASSAVAAAAKVETLQVNFESLLGGVKAAGDMMSRLIKFSARTPFQLEGIAKTARMLLGFGVASDKIIDRLKMLGDVAAGTGRTMDEIGLIFGQIKAKGKLQGEELLQLAERGIPILATLSEQLGKPQRAIQEMITAGKIGFPLVLEAFRRMTSEGGVFANQMEKQSSTLGGLFSTLKDNMFLARAEFGKVLVDLFGLKDVIKDMVAGIQSLTNRFKKFAEERPKLAKFGVMLGVIAAVAGPLVAVLGLVALGISAISAPVLAVVAGGAALTAIFARWYDAGSPLIDVFKSIYETGKRLHSVFSNVTGIDLSPLDIMVTVFDKIGFALAAALTPMAAMFRILTGIVEAVSKLVQLDFAGWWQSVKGSAFDVGDIIGGGFGALGNLFSSPEPAKTAADTRAQRQAVDVNVDGRIDVTAGQGTKLNTVDIMLNRGNNLAAIK